LVDNWKLDQPEPNKLFVGCRGIIVDDEVTREELRKEFQVCRSTELLEVHFSYAIITYENELKCMHVVEKKQGCIFNKKHVTLVPSCNSLSRGRSEIISYYQLKSVNLLSQPINESSRRDIFEIAKKYGGIKRVEISEGKACITFKSCISVINFLAVENGRLFGINNQVAELDDQELSKLTVKERFLPLIYDFKEIIIRGIKSEEEKNDVIKHFNEYGELSQCKVLKNKNKIDGFVTFRHSYSAYKAICIKRPDNSNWHINLAKGALKKIPYLSGNQALIQKVITQQNTVNEMYPNRGYMYTAGVAGNSTFLPGAAMPGGPFNLSVPPPNLVQPPAGPSKSEKANDIEIICTQSICLAYCKTICTTLRCLDLRVGVLNPPMDAAIDQIVDSIKSTGVTAIVFIDKTNEEQETLSAKFLQNSNIKLKDIPLSMAVQEFARAFGREAGQQIEEEKTRDRIHKEAAIANYEQQHKQRHSTQSHHDDIDIEQDRHMRELCYRVTKDSSLSLHENDQLIKYLTECRRIKVAKEYKDYVPHSLRNIPSGPYGDRELKIEKETIESMVTELINRNITDDEMEKSNQVELGDKDKISSAINTLLSLSSDGLKQLSSLTNTAAEEPSRNSHTKEPQKSTSTGNTNTDSSSKARSKASNFWN